MGLLCVVWLASVESWSTLSLLCVSWGSPSSASWGRPEQESAEGNARWNTLLGFNLISSKRLKDTNGLFSSPHVFLNKGLCWKPPGVCDTVTLSSILNAIFPQSHSWMSSVYKRHQRTKGVFSRFCTLHGRITCGRHTPFFSLSVKNIWFHLLFL